MASILYPDGNSESNIRPMNGHQFSVTELQKFVGGTIEIVSIRDGRIMVINENGCPGIKNVRASFLAKTPITGITLTCYHDEVYGDDGK